MKRNPYVLWLASWYPNQTDRFEGDFIQRHAKATALQIPVTVIYISQYGPGVNNENKTVINENDNLKEVIVYFKSPVTGIRIADVLLYNFNYWSTCKRILTSYFRESGLPALLHVHIPLKAGASALWVKRKWGVNYVITEHSTHYGMGSDDDFSAKNFYHRRMVKKIFQSARAVVNVSDTLGSKLRNLFNLAEVNVINNTVDTGLFHFMQNKTPTFRFIHVSSLNDEHKNVSGIIHAIKKFSLKRKDFEFVLVGPNQPYVQKLVSQFELGDIVILKGEMSYEDVSKEMKMASSFVLFSWYENSPCVIAESLCCGLPVISTDVGGIKELIDSSNGILIKPGNEDGLAAAMVQMMDEYPSFSKEIIAGKAAEKFSFDVVGKKIKDIYDAVTLGK